MQFGNARPLSAVVASARTLDPAAFATEHGPAFLLIDDAVAATSSSEQRTISVVGRMASATPSAIFPLVRGKKATFDFVSIGRHENNDVVLPEASVSRFHAFVRQNGDAFTLQDAGSANGTLVDGKPVPKQGAGDPVPLTPGAHVGFGDVRATFLTAALFVELARTVLG